MLALFRLFERVNGFRAQRPSDYTDTQPAFELKQHLNGPMICEGAIYGPRGRVTSRFVGHFQIDWDGDAGVMRERFEYDSGEVQHRAWNLTLKPGGQIEARADDVKGVGRGQVRGATAFLRYRLRLPAEAGGYVLSAEDWMYLAPNGTIVNRSQFRKYGLLVAELVATMRPKEDA
ncbi:DUF3833 family protein [Litorisediminicola beolgyonensis]|uniref:DUF3833 family protein n=1 Tax=Litorisediminicola beolgyonensis TaxID=1173614 RepID=A0ABW3ZDB0_9RHOB